MSGSKSGKKGAVGIVGLGIMGGAFARNLAAAGWQVKGFDADPVRASELALAGVEIASSAGAVAQSAPTVITSLPTPKALEQVAGEIAAVKGKKLVVVEMSTFALADKEKAEKVLAGAGHVLLDCPVSGTGAQAKLKDLVVYASGDRASIAALRPMFSDFSRQTHDLGAFGNGSRMKYLANLLVSIHNVAAAEAMVLGMKAGLNAQKIFDVISTSAGTSRMFEVRGPMMVAGEYDEATMRISMWQKDLAIIGAFAKSLGVPTPTFDATLPVYAEALAAGYGPQDTGAVCAVLEQKAGVKRD
jgi:3-hydroxyisobutyrate dehydrogenase-like beta-hydroxyacid dehydrogenase